jgi:SAM-dependent methyltransferase
MACLSCAWGLTRKLTPVNCRKRQTATATPASPGDGKGELAMFHAVDRPATVKRFDPLRIGKLVALRILYDGLRCVYGFHRWHAGASYASRTYKARTVALVESLKPETVVEIGCGLGEILARTSAKKRFGFDQDPAVIAAARVLHGRSVSFHLAALAAPARIAEIVAGPIDVLIMVNWPHELSIDEIDAALRRLTESTAVSYLVIDAIAEHLEGYQHHHSPADLSRLGEVASVVDGGDGIRQLYAIRIARHRIRLGCGYLPNRAA